MEGPSSLSRDNSLVLYSDEEIIAKNKSVVTDFLEEQSPEEAVDSLKPYLMTPSSPSIMISQIISTALEKKDKERALITELLACLKSSVTDKDYEKAFDELLGSLQDLIYDIPKAAEYIGYFLAQAILSKCIPEDFIRPVKLNEHNLSGSLSEGVLGPFFNTLKEENCTLLKTLYNPFIPKIQSFIKDGKKERFLKSYGLEELLQTDSETPSSMESQQPQYPTQPPSQTEVQPSQTNTHDTLRTSDEFVPDSIVNTAKSRDLSTASEINYSDLQKNVKLPRGRGQKIK